MTSKTFNVVLCIVLLFYIVGLSLIFYASVSKSKHQISDNTAFELFISGGIIVGVAMFGSLFLALSE